MRDGLALEQYPLSIARLHWRTLAIIQRAFDEIACGQQILQALLVLNPDTVATEIICNAYGSDVNLALPKNLLLRQVGGVIRTCVKLHAPLLEPIVSLLRL